MDSLPVETLRMIFEALSIEKTAPDRTIVATPIRTIEDIKSMRFCGPRSALVGIEFLFREIRLFMDEESITKVKWVSEHPDYRSAVRKLTYFPRFFCPYMIKENCYELLEEYRMLMDKDRPIDLHTPSDCESPKKRIRRIEESFALYTKTVKEESEAFLKIESLLPNIIRSFTCIDTVATGFFRTFLSHPVNAKWPGKIERFAQRARDLPKDCFSSGWNLAGDGNLLIKSIAKAATIDGCSKVKSLFLSSYDECVHLRSSLYYSKTFQHAGQIFADLRHLSIGLDNEGSSKEHISLGKLLNQSPHLKTLTVMCPNSESPISVKVFNAVLGQFSCPSLQTLCLQNLAVDSQRLLTLIHRHKLAAFELQNLVLESGSWFQIFAGICDHPPANGFAVRGAPFTLFGNREYVARRHHPPNTYRPSSFKEFSFYGRAWSEARPLTIGKILSRCGKV